MGVAPASGLRLYVLLHDAKPAGPGWKAQTTAVVNPTDQTWRVTAWAGEPAPGNVLDVTAVITRKQLNQDQYLPDVTDAVPVAQSNVVQVRIK